MIAKRNAIETSRVDQNRSRGRRTRRLRSRRRPHRLLACPTPKTARAEEAPAEAASAEDLQIGERDPHEGVKT
jgi:hypothetical protein